MTLSELQRCFEGNHEVYREYSVLLVDLDTVPSDGVDVVISPLRDLELDPRAGEIRLYSAAVPSISNRMPPLSLFEYFAGAWPSAGVHDVDFVMKIRLPIAPEDEAPEPVTFEPLAGVWIGRESEEIWLLVRPESEYPPDLLPA